MHSLLYILVILIAAFHVSTAQVARQQLVTRTSPVELMQTNFGVTGYDASAQSPGGFWPRGSNQQFVFAAGLWIGGLVEDINGDLRKAVFTTYDPNNGKSAATPLTEIEVRDIVDMEIMRSRFTDTVLSAYTYPPEHLASRYPMGLEITQDLMTQNSGQFKDVAILVSTIKNIHPTRTINLMIVDLVIDADIGPRDNPVLASRGDHMRILDDPDELGIVLLGTQPHSNVTYGRLGVVLVNTPDFRTAATIRSQPINVDPVASEERYNLMSTGLRTATTDSTDVRFHIASHTYTVEPGQEMTFRFLLMFSNDDEAIAIPWMIDVAKHFRTHTDVADHEESATIRMYPNPVAQDGMVRISAEHLPERIDLLDALGRTVRTLTHDVSTIDVKGLPAGMYIVRTATGTRCEHLRMMIAK